MLNGLRQTLYRVLPNPPDVWISLHDNRMVRRFTRQQQKGRSLIQKH